MDSALLAALRFAGPAVLVVSVWAVWVRRITFRSRIDSMGTVAVALFGVGAALDSPWPQFSEMSHWITGRYFSFKLAADLCYHVGAALVVGVIYLRLLPGRATRPFVSFKGFMWWFVVPFTVVSSTVMVVCFCASDVPLSMSAVHLHLARPDGWMTAYWITHFSTTALMGLVAVVGVNRLRTDPRAVALNLLSVALTLAALMGGVLCWAVITGRAEPLVLSAWLLLDVAFAAGAVVSAIQWRRRVKELIGPGSRPGGGVTEVADPGLDLNGFVVGGKPASLWLPHRRV